MGSISREEVKGDERMDYINKTMIRIEIETSKLIDKMCYLSEQLKDNSKSISDVLKNMEIVKEDLLFFEDLYDKLNTFDNMVSSWEEFQEEV